MKRTKLSFFPVNVQIKKHEKRVPFVVNYHPIFNNLINII